MAPQLWMLRHGEAVPHDSKPDPERELTPRGRAQSEAAGRALAALNEEFDACYASPKVRAWETASLACKALNVDLHEDVQGIVLSWDTFTESARDAGESRIYGGIHFYEGNVAGLELGKKVGEQAFTKAQQYWSGT